MKNGRIHFMTNEAACLFKSEIIGQLSDGVWENTRPEGHWRFWYEADVVVDGKAYTEGCPLKRDYNLDVLKKYVSEELKDAIRFVRSRFYKPEMMELKRMMTSDSYLNHPEDTPFAEQVAVDIDAYDPIKETPFTFDAFMCKVKQLFSSPSDEFIEAAKKEFIRSRRQNVLDIVQKRAKANADQRAMLAEVGITDWDSFVNAHKEIKSIRVTDNELISVLHEIKSAIRNGTLDAAFTRR